MVVISSSQTEAVDQRDRLLLEVQDRVLWLSMQMIHYANNVRESRDDGKVGGHQASSASVVTLLTYLYFEFMRAGDRISVKPHASPVYHVIQYLLGNLDKEYLKRLRDIHGLQAYPSRTKDPDDVDFSTGSVGLGAVAPNFAALVDEYASMHRDSGERSGNRYINVIGDAELDEGSVWEAIAEPTLNGLGNILWVVDLNRQSLDRIIPGIRVRSWREMFAANGWRVVDAKYGKRLQAAFTEPNGELLRNAIDEMSNEMYQRLLRISPQGLREWLPRTSRYPDAMRRLIGRWSDGQLQDLFRNLGGHDFSMLREALSEVDLDAGPNVVFAYTLKGWALPMIGDPQNHSALLNDRQMEDLRVQLGVPEGDEWARLEPNGEAGRLCQEVRGRLGIGSKQPPPVPRLDIPSDFGRSYRGSMSTQQVFGLVLTDIDRNIPEVSERVVTVSPDVASSTNLGGWINRVGIWARHESEQLPEEDIPRSLRWEERPDGQHIELGISENNLFMMLGQLGSAHESGPGLLFPIGTLYDPFVRRGLDAFVYSVSSGARFVVVATPSGLSLGPEGGSHQSLVTPSIGAEMPDLAFYEPCFGQDLEWILVDALEQMRRRTRSTYLRLSTKGVDQSLLQVPAEPGARERLRRQTLDGAYRLVDRSGEPGYRPGENVVHILACGAMVPEAVEASRGLAPEGVMANVMNVTGPGPLYERFQASVRSVVAGNAETGFMEEVIPSSDRAAPVVTVVDGHPHSLAWVGSALGAATYPLGVSEFGQSGSRPDLYREYGIDVESIMAACFGALDA